MRCNLSCEGCYAAEYQKYGELEPEDQIGAATGLVVAGATFLPLPAFFFPPDFLPPGFLAPPFLAVSFLPPDFLAPDFFGKSTWNYEKKKRDESVRKFANFTRSLLSLTHSLSRTNTNMYPHTHLFSTRQVNS